jgi:hypothetical protein
MVPMRHLYKNPTILSCMKLSFCNTDQPDYAYRSEVHPDGIEIVLSYKQPKQLLAQARESLDTAKPTKDLGFIVTTERAIISEKPQLTVHFAYVHTTSILERIVSIPSSKMPEAIFAHEMQKAIKRYQLAQDREAPLPPKITDIIAYTQDFVFSVGIFLQDNYGNILIQQRPDGKKFGSFYCQPTANGKLENWQEALQREASEEWANDKNAAEIQLLIQNLKPILVAETPYTMRSKGVEVNVIGRDYIAKVDRNIASDVIRPNTNEVLAMHWVNAQDMINGKIVSESMAKKQNLSPKEYFVFFDDQYESLKRVFDATAIKTA